MLRKFIISLVISLTALSAQASEWVYVMNEGDTLWDFSARNLKNPGRWKDLQRLNAITNPKDLRPGHPIRVPVQWIKQIPASAKVIISAGRSTLKRRDGSSEDVAQGTIVQLGDRITVPENASLAIEFADGSRISLYEKTTVLFDHLSQYGESGMVDTRLKLEEGRSETKAQKASGSKSRFEIQTPSAITSVRGTDFRTTVKGADEVSRVEVLEGKVAVNAEKAQRLIPAGYGTRVNPGMKPVKPRKLLAAPTFTAIPDLITAPIVSISWSSIDKAEGYRAEISQDNQFQTLLLSREMSSPKFVLPELADGQYYLRVRAIDSLGIEGKSQVAKLNMDTFPRAPLLLNPAEDQLHRGAAPELSWSKPDDIGQFRLQLSEQPNFEPLLLNEVLERSRYALNVPPNESQYYWRLASIKADGEQGPFSKARSFRLRPEPKVKAMEPVTEGEFIVVAWEAADDDTVKYQVQVSENEDFSTLLDDQVMTESRILLDKNSGSLRYVRVRVVSDDGYEGSWMIKQRIYPEQSGIMWWFGAALLGIILL